MDRCTLGRWEPGDAGCWVGERAVIVAYDGAYTVWRRGVATGEPVRHVVSDLLGAKIAAAAVTGGELGDIYGEAYHGWY